METKKEKTIVQKFLEKYSANKIFRYSFLIVAIIIFIDEINLLTYLKENINILFIIFPSAFAFTYLADLKIEKLCSIKMFNFVDYSIAILLVSNTLLIFIYHFSFESSYKIFILLRTLLIILIAFTCRYLLLNPIYKKTVTKTNVLDLKDILSNNFPEQKFDRIFLSDDAVDYDLLNRENTISNLYFTIRDCYLNNQYVISLIGKWGTGKTTLIKRVRKEFKDNDDLLIIDDFNPWIYNDEKSLLKDMISKIFKKLNINYTLFELNKYSNAIVSLLFKTDVSVIDRLSTDTVDLEKLKNMVNEYLINNDKRLLFIIDNIERAKPDNILMILKSVKNILDFNRTIYLISYDDEVMEQIFAKYFPYDIRFLEKISQQEIRIPRISDVLIKELYSKSLTNILNYYADTENKDELLNVYESFFEHTESIRDIKRNINSLLNVTKTSDGYLNKGDYISMLYVYKCNKELYDEIYKNGKYFISENVENIDGYWSFYNEDYNKNCHNYYKSLFSNEYNKGFLNFLANVFPNVKKYKDNMTSSNIPDYKKSTNILNPDKSFNIMSNIERRIFNAKFFELYFTPEISDYIKLFNSVEKFVDVLNNENIFEEEKNQKFKDLLNTFDGNHHKHIIETLEYFVSKIKDLKLLYKMLLDNYKYINNDLEIFNISARNRSCKIMSEILLEILFIDTNDIEKYVIQDYKCIGIYNNLLYWLKPRDYNKNDEKLTKVYPIIKNKLSEYLENMIKNNINLYDDEFYSSGNIYCFDKEKKEHVNYIRSFINNKTIFKFLSDMISISSSSTGQYYYKLKSSYIENYIELDDIEKMLNDNNSLGDKENLIKQIYSCKINAEDENDEFNHGYETNTIIDIDLTVK